MSLRVTVEEFSRLREKLGVVPFLSTGEKSATVSKYRNRKTTIDGKRFDSTAEARRYGELLALQRAGEITDLALQPKFNIYLNDVHICDYYADFAYSQKGRYIVEDVKGVRTDVYRLKKRLVEARYGITITEVRMGKR